MNSRHIMKALFSTGLANEPEEFVKFTDEPKIAGYLTRPRKSENYNTNDAYGQSYDFNSNKAKVKSVAEFLERICLFNPQNDKLSQPIKFEEKSDFVDPAAFFCYSENQVNDRDKIVKTIQSESYKWVKGIDFFEQRNVMLPAQRVFLSDFSDEFPIRKETTSNGTALGKRNKKDAFERGLLELIERDASMHAYLTKRKLFKIKNCPEEITKINEYLDRYHLEAYSFDAFSDLGVPVVITITIDRTGIGPAVTVGSAADLTYIDALRHSILESIQCRSYARLMRKTKFPDKLPSENEITSLENRLFYWYPVERIPDLNFWFRDAETKSYSQLNDEKISIKQIMDKFREKDLHLYSVDITLPEIAHAGFQVVEAVCPELHPLYLDERAKPLYSTHYGTILNNTKLKPSPFT